MKATVKSLEKLTEHKNGNYTVTIYSDGTKIRDIPDDVDPVPEYPESIDLNVSNRCDAGCPYCYAGNHPNGIIAEVSEFEWLLSQIPAGTEVAINLNEAIPPNLTEMYGFLKYFKERNIISNLTVNIRHLSPDLIRLLEVWQQDDLVYGVGISFKESPRQNMYTARAIMALQKLDNVVFHLIAGLFNPKAAEEVEELIASNPGKIKLLFLGYKLVSPESFNYYGVHKKEIEYNKEWLKSWLRLTKKDLACVGFDNKAMVDLDEKPTKENYMGDEGEYTMYIDLPKNEYNISSLSTHKPMSLSESFGLKKMFQYVREHRHNNVQ